LNQGIEFLREKHPVITYIVSVNPDIVPLERGWLSSIISDMDQFESNIGIAGCVLMKDDKIVQHAGAYGDGSHIGYDEEIKTLCDNVRIVPWVTGACMVIKTEVLDKIGLFDEEHHVHFGSDREFCKRARKAGYEIICSPIKLKHYYGWSSMVASQKADIPVFHSKVADGIYRQALSQSVVNMRDTTEISAPDFIKERIEKYGFGN